MVNKLQSNTSQCRCWFKAWMKRKDNQCKIFANTNMQIINRVKWRQMSTPLKGAAERKRIYYKEM